MNGTDDDIMYYPSPKLIWNWSFASVGEFSPCLTNNGGCQDLCLLTSEGRVNCSCRGERKLLGDNTCVGERDKQDASV